MCIHKAFIVELELEYARASNTLIVHQHDIRGLKEEVCLMNVPPVNTNISAETAFTGISISCFSKVECIGGCGI